MYVHGESHVGFVAVVVGWRTALFHHQMQLVQERRGPAIAHSKWQKFKLATFLPTPNAKEMPRHAGESLGIW